MEILNAIAGRNLLAKITAFYQAEVAEPRSPRRSVALVALAHLAQYSGDIAREITLREQAVEARPTPMNWFLLADACRRGGPARAANARRAYVQALQNPAALPEGAANEARQYLQARPVP